MNVDGTPFRTIWRSDDGWSVEIIDQTKLPHAFETLRLCDVGDAARAIREMEVRGAPLNWRDGGLWGCAGDARRRV